MKQSMRAKRMERHHKRQGQQAKLSLVSLMDIFTILVFFLMLNASDVQVLDNHKSVSLPQSSADTPAKETLLILVNNKDLMLQGQRLASVPELLSSADDTIEALTKELDYQKVKAAQRSSMLDENGDPIERSITIMGDEAVPYLLLKKIMQTCAQAGYTDVSLAVEQIPGSQENGA